ncbi:MAG: hypothetical protein AABY22_14130 [Nanoarchaeota archaeon]
MFPKLGSEFGGREYSINYNEGKYVIRVHEKHDECLLFNDEEKPLAKCFVCKRKILRNDITIDEITLGVDIINFQHLECFPIEEVEREKIEK